MVILGPGPVTELFGGDAGAAIGSDVRIGRTSFRVIGVTKPAQQNDLVIMPIEAARSYVLGGDDSVDRVLVEAASAAAVPAALERGQRDPVGPAQHRRAVGARLRGHRAAGAAGRGATSSSTS